MLEGYGLSRELWGMQGLSRRGYYKKITRRKKKKGRVD